MSAIYPLVLFLHSLNRWVVVIVVCSTEKKRIGRTPVSYTHLTLPTILLV